MPIHVIDGLKVDVFYGKIREANTPGWMYVPLNVGALDKIAPPNSDPRGPYPTEAEALAAARGEVTR